MSTNEVKITDEKTAVEKKTVGFGYYAKIGLTLLVISAVTASLLALVNAITKDKIAENERAVMEQALESIFGGCDEIEEMKGEYGGSVIAVYSVYSEGKLLGYGIQAAPTGFKDAIGLIVGTTVEGECLGVKITSISDTPGVGTKVKENSFLSGFKGLNNDTVDSFDTISGATISSKAVKQGVAEVLALDIYGYAE